MKIFPAIEILWHVWFNAFDAACEINQPCYYKPSLERYVQLSRYEYYIMYYEYSPVTVLVSMEIYFCFTRI